LEKSLKGFKKLFENFGSTVLVIEDDKRYSSARIAGYVANWQSLAEGEQHFSPELFVAFSDGIFRVLKPGDSRRPIMFVAVGDFFEFLNFNSNGFQEKR